MIDKLERTLEREKQFTLDASHELLMISRMDRNTLKADIEEVDFGELLNFVCDEQSEIQSNKIDLIRDIDENIVVDVDRDMLVRLAINLVSNAYSYGADGGRINVSLKSENKKAVLRVSDNGIGISKEDIPKIWERFYRVDKSRYKNENESMRLGLSIVKQIADFHAGSVNVESELGKESTFIFEMPMRKYE